MKRLIFALILAASLTTLALTGCGETEDDTALVEFEDWQSYTIVRPDVADQSTISAATTLVKAFESSTGAKPQLATDWVKRGEAAPTGTKEILIGATNRPESENELKYSDYVVKFENDRLVINGGSGEAVLAAVEWYCENCLDGGVYIPKDGYTYRGEYPLENVKLGGIPLSEFAVDGGSSFTNEAEELEARLLTLTGASPKEENHTIYIKTDETLPLLSAEVKPDGGDFIVAVNPNGVGIQTAIDLFFECIEKRTGDDILPDERIEIEMDNVKQLTDKQIAEWRAKTDERIKAILGSKNMVIPAGKTVYYVSPNGDDSSDGKTPETAWKTLDKVNNAPLASGSYVCFERGGLWRGQLQAKPGVTYTAFGEGDKPKLYRSPFNGADPSLWTKTDA
ncbi:MAG: hypothetical protein ACI4T6_01815, partial [Candidatus Flemingiibacterium sp.]